MTKPIGDQGAAAREQDVIAAERDAISLDRPRRIDDAAAAPWAGIGLSGGGIRSATFCLGVLQALAESDLLRRFDYISSVSGGGYIATSLQWWWGSRSEDGDKKGEARFGVEAPNFPYGPARPSPGRTMRPTPEQELADSNLAFLRAHSSYLTPGHGISIWSILGVLFRTIIISSFTWLPILTFVFVLLALASYLLDKLFSALNVPSPLFGMLPSRWMEACDKDFYCFLDYSGLYAGALWLFYLLAGIFVIAALLFALVSHTPQERDYLRTLVKFSLLASGCAAGLAYIFIACDRADTSIILLASILAVTLAASLVVLGSEVLTPRSLNASYWLRRTIERIMGQAFIPSVAMLVYSTIPVIPVLTAKYLAAHGLNASIVALAGLLSGVGSALYGYYTFVRNIVPGLVGQLAASIAAIIGLYMMAVVAYVGATMFLHANSEQFSGWTVVIFVGIGGAMVLAFVMAVYTNVNLIGFHRFYRDRLMETFMPEDAAVRAMQADFSPVADTLSVAALRRFFAARKDGDDWHARPYPLINTNVILLKDDDQKVASRGGDNFLISPLFVGSTSTGWEDTQKYIELNGPLTLASAMAASGAAANASAGYIGTGITTNPLVSRVMSLLNIRLGLWVGNPSRRRRVRSIPTFLLTALYSGYSAHRRDSAFLELTDGGHFENLGLYELVRRKLDIILIVDGEEDPSINLSSLVSATHRIEQDFGARLDFATGEGGPERLVMYPGSGGYPYGVKYAKASFLVGTIAYNDGSHGVLIYVKATIIREMDFTTAGYLANNPAFPHQTTANQFFRPEQFDAYRMLGHESALQMIAALDLQTSIKDSQSVVSTYTKGAAAEAAINEACARQVS